MRRGHGDQDAILPYMVFRPCFRERRPEAQNNIAATKLGRRFVGQTPSSARDPLVALLRPTGLPGKPTGGLRYKIVAAEKKFGCSRHRLPRFWQLRECLEGFLARGSIVSVRGFLEGAPRRGDIAQGGERLA